MWADVCAAERVRRARALNSEKSMTPDELTSPEPTASGSVHVNQPSTDRAQTLINRCDAPASPNSGDNPSGIPSPPIHRNAPFDVPHIPPLADCNVSLNDSNVAQPLPKEYDLSKRPYIDSNALPEEIPEGFVSSSKWHCYGHHFQLTNVAPCPDLDQAQPRASPDSAGGGGSQFFFDRKHGVSSHQDYVLNLP